MSEKEKTLFFVVTAKSDLREFVIPPNSVLDRLSRTPNLRIVVLGLTGKLKEFDHLFQKYKALPNVELQPINNVVPKGVFQKSFIFFVKYLIFTDTMHILATEGVRPDVPPAGGLKYLYFLKRAIYAVFGSSKWIKKKIIPKLFNVVFSEKHYSNLFDKYKPDAVFIADIKPFLGQLFLREAKRRNIRTIQTPGNWDHFKYYLSLQSDVMLASNEPLKKEATECHSYREDQIELTGFPRFDFYIDKKNLLPREEYLKQFGFTPDVKVILFVSEAVYSLDGGDIVNMIVKWIEEKKLPENTRVLLRPYPPYPGVIGEKEKYGKFEGHPLVAFETTESSMTVDNMKNFVNLVAHVDVLVNTYSTMAIEGLVFNKPVVNIGFDGYHKRPMHQSVKRFEHLMHFQHVTETPGVRTVKSKEELFKDLKEYVENPTHNQKERDTTRDRMCYKLDGKAVDRVVTAILRELNLSEK